MPTCSADGRTVRETKLSLLKGEALSAPAALAFGVAWWLQCALTTLDDAFHRSFTRPMDGCEKAGHVSSILYGQRSGHLCCSGNDEFPSELKVVRPSSPGRHI